MVYSLSHGLLRCMQLIFQIIWSFLHISNLILLWSEKYSLWFHSLDSFLYFCMTQHMISLGYLMCISKEFVFWSCWVKCSIKINLFNVVDSVVQSLYILTFYCSCSIGLSIIDRGVLKSPIIIIDLSISPFSSISFWFMYFEALSISAYIFRILSFLWIGPFIIWKCPFISSSQCLFCLIVTAGFSTLISI